MCPSMQAWPLPVTGHYRSRRKKYILLFEQCLFCGAKKYHKSKRTFKNRPDKEDIPKHMKVVYPQRRVSMRTCRMST